MGPKRRHVHPVRANHVTFACAQKPKRALLLDIDWEKWKPLLLGSLQEGLPERELTELIKGQMEKGNWLLETLSSESGSAEVRLVPGLCRDTNQYIFFLP